EEGLVARTEDGRRATYALTDAGRAELDSRRSDLSELESDLAESVREVAAQVGADVRDTMAGLRADLAAAAQQARATARPGPPAGRDEHRAEAEALVAQFRADLVADLRRADARGGVSRLTVDTLRAVLDQARAAVRGTL
ncbi:MAG TPA: PadR family transcriptional regulator, partial [Actinotalea sp.]|nr:PadR family transcriptional regulator [Actinotalea sp.]